MAIEDVTRDQLLAEIAEMLREPAQPEGSFTASQIADEMGLTLRQAVAKLTKARKNGLVERIVIGRSTYFRKLTADVE